MERFYSLFQTCAAATYLCRLWLSQHPSVNKSNRTYTQSKKLTVFFWVRKEMSIAVSKKGYVQTVREHRRRKDK